MYFKVQSKVLKESVSFLVVMCCLGWGVAISAAEKEESAILISAGTSRWHISLMPQASVCEKFATEELSKYIKQITGVTLGIKEELTPSEMAIRITGNNTEEVDGFQITVMSNQIVLQGSTRRGALYAVYQLLEDMGCRWFYLGALGEVVPKKDEIELPLGMRADKASFLERSIILGYPHYFEQFDEWIDFCGKLKINNILMHGQTKPWWVTTGKQYLADIEKRGIIMELGGHLLPDLIPRTIFEEHPEYFRMDNKGKRNSDYNLCVRSEGVNIAKKNYQDYLNDMEGFRYFHAWADDIMGGGWCSCPQCKELSPSGQNLLAMNALAEVLGKKFPNSFIADLAYHDTAEVPRRVRPHKNVFLLHAPRERCYAHAINDPKCRRNREEYLPHWEKRYEYFGGKDSKTTHCFEYYTDAILNREMQPPNIEVIPADARYYRKLQVPVFQNLVVAFRDWHSPPISLVIFARAAWNADIEGKDVVSDFCRYYYGEKLAPLMEDYYWQVEKSCNLFFEADAIYGSYCDMTSIPLDEKTNKIKIPQDWEAQKTHQKLAGRLSAALKTIEGGILVERLQRELDVCELHDLVLLMSVTQFEGRFLAYQFLSGKVGREEGKRALDILNQCLDAIKNVNKWVERFPEEQQLWIGGWQDYHDRFFADMIIADRDKVKEKLINDIEPESTENIVDNPG